MTGPGCPARIIRTEPTPGRLMLARLACVEPMEGHRQALVATGPPVFLDRCAPPTASVVCTMGLGGIMAEDFRSARMPSPEGQGRAKGRLERAWDGYSKGVNKVAGPVMAPLAKRIGAATATELLGF